jgi:hypothetical protein
MASLRSTNHLATILCTKISELGSKPGMRTKGRVIQIMHVRFA